MFITDIFFSLFAVPGTTTLQHLADTMLLKWKVDNTDKVLISVYFFMKSIIHLQYYTKPISN